MSLPPPPIVSGVGPTTARREALRLYREILKTARGFTWTNEHGVRWGEVLAKSARAEFEAARYEKDPELIARMLVTGRDCLMKTQDKVREQHDKLLQDIERTRNEPHRTR